MKPYYEHAGVTIYHGDCREVLAAFPDAKFDALITDPPYGVNLKTKTSDYRQSKYFDGGKSLQSSVLYDDDPERVRNLIREAIPLALSRSSRAVIFSGPKMVFSYPEPDTLGCVFIPNGAGRSPWGFQCMQPILFYGKDPFNATRPNSFKTEQPNREKFDHPCPKPVQWMKWAIARATQVGDFILDPFCGSGTTLVAAKNLGRRAIGIEIEERYCEIAAKRLSQEVLPLVMP